MSYEPLVAGAPRSNVFDEHLYKVRITFGSAAMASYRSKDATPARTDTGKYTITLPKTYAEITDFSCGFYDASGAILFGVIETSAVTTTGVVTVEFRTEAGTATDPTTGSVAYITLGVSSNTLNDKFTG